MPYPYTSYQNPYQYYPVYQQPQIPQQPIQQASQQAQTFPQTQQTIYSNGIIWVANEREAETFPVGPNNAVALWESSGKRAYMKKADATGKPSMTIYDLVERSQSVSDGVSESGEKLPAYATKDDLSAVVGVVKGFDQIIASMKSDIEKMSGDLYGIAGKKKGKKAEVSDDDE